MRTDLTRQTRPLDNAFGPTGRASSRTRGSAQDRGGVVGLSSQSSKNGPVDVGLGRPASRGTRRGRRCVSGSRAGHRRTTSQNASSPILLRSSCHISAGP